MDEGEEIFLTKNTYLEEKTDEFMFHKPLTEEELEERVQSDKCNIAVYINVNK